MGLQEFDLDVQKKNYLMPWNLSAEKVKFALKSLLLIWDLMHYTKDYYIDGRNTRFCQFPLGEGF